MTACRCAEKDRGTYKGQGGVDVPYCKKCGRAGRSVDPNFNPKREAEE